MALAFDRYERMSEDDRISALLGAIDEMIVGNGDAEASERAANQRLDSRWVPDKKEKRIKWLYDILTTLDNKTAHLLRLNSMLLAAQSFLVGALELSNLSGGVRGWLVALLFVPFAGIYYALEVFGVAWPFLPWKLRIDGVSQSFEDECRDLARVCVVRTIKHANVLRFTTISVVGAFLLLLIVGGILIFSRGDK